MTSEFESYDTVDPVLMPWAMRHGIRVEMEDRGWNVRSIWVYDKNGNRRAQMWLNPPDADGGVTIIASALDPTSPTKWGSREERRAFTENLEAVLEELRPIVFSWAGDGAYT
jgi:hypothetical protein